MFRLKRGLKLDTKKISADNPISPALIPDELIIPLKQHLGEESKAAVKKGDYVKKYQLIGKADGEFSANIHASSSGEVIAVEKRPVIGGESTCVVIKTDKKDKAKKFKPKENLNETVKNAGIVGMGGACFPTHIKLNPSVSCDLYILNGCECEPYLTSDLRIMLEFPKDVISGFRELMKAAGIKHGIVGVENEEAYENLTKASNKYKNIEIKLLKAKYPQGAEKMLIYSLTGRKVPTGKIPADVGVIVNNVSTAWAVNLARQGMPLTERVVTISGNVGNPKNLMVRIGTKLSDIIKKDYEKIIAGGPMMGIAVPSKEVPLTKGTSGLIMISQLTRDYENCIRCSSCIDACPMNLMPTKLATYSATGNYEKANEHYLFDCFECGCCTYVCPSHIPIVQLIKAAKAELKNANK